MGRLVLFLVYPRFCLSLLWDCFSIAGRTLFVIVLHSNISHYMHFDYSINVSLFDEQMSEITCRKQQTQRLRKHA